MVQVIQILVFRGILFQNIYMSIKGEKYYFKTIVHIVQNDILNIDYAIEFDFSCSKWCAKRFRTIQWYYNQHFFKIYFKTGMKRIFSRQEAGKDKIYNPYKMKTPHLMKSICFIQEVLGLFSTLRRSSKEIKIGETYENISTKLLVTSRIG